MIADNFAVIMNPINPSKKRSTDADTLAIGTPKKAKIVNVLEGLELANAKSMARKWNPRGVMVLLHEFASADAFVAGYCRFKNTLELNSFLVEGALATEVIDVWAKARGNRFGISDKDDAFDFKRKTLFDLLMNETLMTKEVLSLKIPLPNSKPFKGENRVYFSWIVTMWQLIDGAPHYFPDTNTDAAKLMGASPEDWHRAYFLLRSRWGCKYDRHSMSEDRAKENYEAVEPQFLTLEDIAAEDLMRRAETLSRLRALANTVYEPEKGLSMKYKDDFSTLVEDSIESQLVTDQNKTDLIRAALSLQDQKAALRGCYQGLLIYYPISEEQLLMLGGHFKPASFLQSAPSLIQCALLLENARSNNNGLVMNSELVRVGAAIPPYQILTVELALSKNQQNLYDAIHKEHSPRLSSKETDYEKNENMVMNMAVHRRLTHATFNTQLVKFDEVSNFKFLEFVMLTSIENNRRLRCYIHHV